MARFRNQLCQYEEGVPTKGTHFMQEKIHRTALPKCYEYCIEKREALLDQYSQNSIIQAQIKNHCIAANEVITIYRPSLYLIKLCGESK